MAMRWLLVAAAAATAAADPLESSRSSAREIGASATAQLPKACAGPPKNESAYQTCIEAMYKFDKIRQSVNRRFRSCRHDNPHFTSKDCAMWYYSTVKSPEVYEDEEASLHGCPEAAGKTMKELDEMARDADVNSIECIMQVSMKLNVKIDCESNVLGRDLYKAIDSQGNIRLLEEARADGFGMKEQAHLAIQYRNWAKNMMKDVLMIGVMHNLWGADILYVREEKRFGAARGRSVGFQMFRACRKLGYPSCSNMTALTSRQKHKIYNQIIKDAIRTNPHIDKTLDSCPQSRPRCHAMHSWCLLGYTHVVPEVAWQLCPTNEFWGWLYILLLLLLWRLITVNLDETLGLQEKLSQCLGRFKVYAQWYTGFLVIMWWEFFLAFRNIWRYDYCHSDSCGGFGLKIPEGKEIATSVWLLGTFAPLATFIALSMVTVHVVLLGRGLSRQTMDLWQGDATIVVLLLPGFFGLMSVSAFSRMWQLTYGGHLSGTKEDYISLFKSDLSLAIFVEILTMYVFARLATDHLCDHLEEEKEYQESLGATPAQSSADFPQGLLARVLPCVPPKPTIFWLSMNAVYLCVILGVFQCALQVVNLLAYRRLQLNQNPFLPTLPISISSVCGTTDGDLATMIFCRSSSLVMTIDKLASLAMMLCAYNMYFVCGLPAVEERLPKANLKFNGTRIIVMLAQIQGKLLIPEKTLHESFASQGNLLALILGADGYHTALFHVILTQYELLVIIVIHAMIWSERRAWRDARSMSYLPVE
eukprot:TRINITY_DN72638_c0_g1_i1.p1 TRINITY_DN72638_c0_g1~~TRINITY_DN72638_c0_g1_i1.p1  ORF type:complete len:759 (-),score=136.43 TRINITY_DN72638_c0_g1_i1:9-2285(-)